MQREPIRYVDALNDFYRGLGHPPYRWSENDDAPLHRLERPLSECTVSMLVSGGVSKITSPPFNPEEFASRWRERLSEKSRYETSRRA